MVSECSENCFNILNYQVKKQLLLYVQVLEL